LFDRWAREAPSDTVAGAATLRVRYRDSVRFHGGYASDEVFLSLNLNRTNTQAREIMNIAGEHAMATDAWSNVVLLGAVSDVMGQYFIVRK